MLFRSPKEIKDIEQSVIDFAELGKFINQPVKTYSSGMRSRLGFAISININPDILIIDEALAVGDMSFSQKCMDKMTEIKEQGKTIFFVSHSVGQINSFCTKALWLEYGILKAYGNVKEVTPMYERFAKIFNKMTPAERVEYRNGVLNFH